MVQSEFEEFEQEYSLFDIEINNILIWERIRFNVWRNIKQQMREGKAHSTIDTNLSNYLKGGYILLKNLVFKNPYRSNTSDFLFFSVPRRKKENGYWWDIYFDPIYELCDLDYVHIETSDSLRHRRPIRTENFRYADLIRYGSTLQKKLGIGRPEISATEREKLSDIEHAIKSEFGVELDIQSMVYQTLHGRNTQLWMYEKLLKKIKPNITVILSGVGKSTFIEVCKDMNIPVVEFQHGVIHDRHMAYSYPGTRTKEMFPDYLLVWGDYWKNAVEYPISDKRVIPVGYPYLEQTIEKYENKQSRDQILFISQGTIGEQLSRFAMEVNQHPDISHDVVYKLHPGEYDRWRDEYPWLTDAAFEIIDSSEPPLYELFAKSSVQIGVGSTAVYEGLCFDLETYVYDCSGSSVLDPLVEEGAAELISSVDELASSLRTGEMTFNREHYFEANATENACQALQRLASEGSSQGLESR